MKTIAIHSHKGGVGKTTVALLLAKSAAASQKVCLVDCDFIGTGVADLLLMKAPSRFLEDFFLDGEPHRFPLKSLLGSYSDRDIGERGFSIVLSKGVSRPKSAKDRLEIRQAMMGLVANEPHYREIEMKTEILLDLLQKDAYDLAIFDCHPGLVLVSNTLIPLADLNVYVTTPNRSDCFGLLKEINLRKLDQSRAFLIVNRAVEPGNDLKSFRSAMERDAVIGMEAGTVLAQLKHLGRDEGRVFFVPESEKLRSVFYIGRAGLLPAIRPDQDEFGFCQRVLSAL
jgi:cellulose biosynthesis protein BcsQ